MFSFKYFKLNADCFHLKSDTTFWLNLTEIHVEAFDPEFGLRFEPMTSGS